MKSYDNAILQLILEAGLLKRVKRSGWWICGIKEPESVADHSFRGCLLGYVMARQEKADALKVMLMCLFGDLHEARICDSHKMAQAYLDWDRAEKKANAGQLKNLPQVFSRELMCLRREYLGQKTLESRIARDADILECLIQAKEYLQQGYTQAEKFTRKAPAFLKTRAARALWQTCRKADLNRWWLKIARFKR